MKGAVTFGCLFLWASVSCTETKVLASLEQRKDYHHSELDKIRSDIRHKEAQDLVWSVALERMFADNSGLKRSQRNLAEAKKAKADSWGSLIPRVTIFFGLSSFLSDLADLSVDDVTGQVNAGFNIPNPFNFYAQLYGNELNSISSEWSHEVDRRQACRELYVAFRRAQDLEKQGAELLVERQKLKELSLANLPSALQQIENSEENYQRSYEQSRSSFNRLLGTPGAHWKPVGALPNVSYEKRFERFEFGKDIGKLGLKIEAAQIEASHLNVKRVKLQRWPAINFGLSGPPLFTTTSAANDFEIGNFNFFSGLGESIDLRDPLDAEDIQNAEIRLQSTLAQMRVQLESQLIQFEQAKREYRKALKEKRILQKRMASLRRSKVTSADALLEHFQQSSNLRNSLRQVEAKINRLDLEYWVWDDNAWG